MLIKTCSEINFPRAEVVYVWSIPSAWSCLWYYFGFGDHIGDTAQPCRLMVGSSALRKALRKRKRRGQLLINYVHYQSLVRFY